MAGNSSKTAAARKTKHLHLLPRADFPLSPHVAGKRWFKTIRGQRFYYGPLNDPAAAEALWSWEREFRERGLVPPPMPKVGDASRVSPVDTSDYLTLADLAGNWLEADEALVETKELSPRTFRDHQDLADLLVARWGKTRAADSITAAEFQALRTDLAQKMGPDAVNKRVYLTRAMFNYGHRELKNSKTNLPAMPAPDFGTRFEKMAEKTVEAARADRKDPTLTAEQIHKLLNSASVGMRAAILLALNAGFGNNDIGMLPKAAIDLDGGFVEFPRPKTARKRRAALWPQTVEAVRAALAVRPKPKVGEDDGLVFLTRQGRPFVRETNGAVKRGVNAGKQRVVPSDALAQEFQKLLTKHGLTQRGRGFYCLRHTFRTIADDAGDMAAVDFVMGHLDKRNMSRFYTHRNRDKQLRAVADHVGQWFYGDAWKAGTPADAKVGQPEGAAR